MKPSHVTSHSEKFTEYSNNIRKTWDLLKLLLSRERYQLPPCVFYDCDGQPLASTSEIAKSFNEYFSTIGTKLAQKITPGNTFYKQYLGDPFSINIFGRRYSRRNYSNIKNS